MSEDLFSSSSRFESDSRQKPDAIAIESTGYLHERSWAERNGFPYWLLAFIWLLVSFVLFQLAGLLALVVAMVLHSEDVSGGVDAAFLAEHIDLVFLGNSLGQILFLGVTTWFVAGLSTSGRRLDFLRMGGDGRTAGMGFFTVVLVVVMQPVVWALAWLNAQVPLPQNYLDFEASQIEMIRDILTGDHIVLLTLFHVALVPSVCEEVLFRGYIQRSLEKSWGIWVAIVLGGVLFGLYHVRLTQLIPLAVIGIVLGWVAWRSGSIWPAVAGHFMNNAGSVIVASLYPEYMDQHMDLTVAPPVWLLLVSLAGTVMLLYRMQTFTRKE